VEDVTTKMNPWVILMGNLATMDKNILLNVVEQTIKHHPLLLIDLSQGAGATKFLFYSAMISEEVFIKPFVGATITSMYDTPRYLINVDRPMTHGDDYIEDILEGNE